MLFSVDALTWGCAHHSVSAEHLRTQLHPVPVGCAGAVCPEKAGALPGPAGRPPVSPQEELALTLVIPFKFRTHFCPRTHSVRLTAADEATVS